MTMIHEYALLIAVAMPVVAIVGLNAYLLLSGERMNLLMPGLWWNLPSIRLDAAGTATPEPATPPSPPANQDEFRLAA